jgi:hypothetical protein
MATFYIPDENGWASGNYYTRLKVEQSYNSANNRSMFTVTPQFRGAYEYNTANITGGSITADDITFKTFGIEDGGYPYRAVLLTTWSDIYVAYSGYPGSWSFQKDHDGYGNCTVNFTNTVVLGENTAVFNGSTSTTFPGTARTYSLTITTDAHSHVTVTRNGVELVNGATLTHGDRIVVTFSADNGYAILTHTVNGYIVESGFDYWVTGDISVIATSEALGLVYIRRSENFVSHKVYIRKSGTWVQYRPYIFKNGAYVPYG